MAAMPVGLAAGVSGLVGAAQHNGKRGMVASGPGPISGRYKVRLDSGGNEDGRKGSSRSQSRSRERQTRPIFGGVINATVVMDAT